MADAAPRKWIMNYSDVLGCLLQNTEHEYVGLQPYFSLVEQIIGLRQTANAKLFWTQLLTRSLDRVPSPNKIVGLQIDSGRIGRFGNQAQFVDWVKESGKGKFNGADLFRQASPIAWVKNFDAMLEVGLIKINQNNLIYPTYPVQGKLLSPCFAYIALLSRFKRDGEVKRMVREMMENTPDTIRAAYKDWEKDDLITELVAFRMNDLKYNSREFRERMFKELVAKVEQQFPHKFYKLRPEERDGFQEQFDELTGEQKSVAAIEFERAMKAELDRRDLETKMLDNPKPKSSEKSKTFSNSESKIFSNTEGSGAPEAAGSGAERPTGSREGYSEADRPNNSAPQAAPTTMDFFSPAPKESAKKIPLSTAPPLGGTVGHDLDGNPILLDNTVDEDETLEDTGISLVAHTEPEPETGFSFGIGIQELPGRKNVVERAIEEARESSVEADQVIEKEVTSLLVPHPQEPAFQDVSDDILPQGTIQNPDDPRAMQFWTGETDESEDNPE